MSLNKAIRQSKFRNEYQKALINLQYTNNYLADQMNEVFKDFEITRQQYNLLRILRGQHPDPICVNLIKERMIDKMSDVSRIVQRLKMKGFVSRAASRRDKRVVEVQITPKGLDLLSRMDPEVDDLEALLHNLSEDEARLFNQLLDKIRAKRTEFSEDDTMEFALVHQHEKF